MALYFTNPVYTCQVRVTVPLSLEKLKNLPEGGHGKATIFALVPLPPFPLPPPFLCSGRLISAVFLPSFVPGGGAGVVTVNTFKILPFLL